jgi:predicted nucleotidyltransferase
MRKNLDIIQADASANRQAIFHEVANTFTTQYDAVVTSIGSMSRGGQDLLSDIDVWVSVPDDAMDEVLESRHELYARIGSDLVTWERPKFAPLGGVHSIVLYDGEKTISPTEVDYYIAPVSQSDYYRDFIDGKSVTQDYEWKTGPDDESIGAQLDYASLVTMWAGKYWHRRIEGPKQLAWAVSRFNGVSEAAELDSNIPESAMGNIGTLAVIIDSLHDKAVQLGDPKRSRAYTKIADTIRLLETLDAQDIE